MLAIACLLSAAGAATPVAAATNSATSSLLALKAAVSGSSNALASWTSTTSPCDAGAQWIGVNCTAGRVTSM